MGIDPFADSGPTVLAPMEHVWVLLRVREAVRRFTWGRLALSDQEGALRVPRSHKASGGFISRNVLEEPPAAEAGVIHTGS